MSLEFGAASALKLMAAVNPNWGQNDEVGLHISFILNPRLKRQLLAEASQIVGKAAATAFIPKLDFQRGKWTNDTISGGRFSLTENDGDFDLLVTDSLGRVFSSKQEGAKIIVMNSSDKSLTVLVAYPKLVETYTFLRNEDGQAEAIWTTNKWGTPIPKVAAFRAACSFFAR